MNELDKAQEIIADSNFKMKEFAEKYKVNYNTLYSYVSGSKQLKNARWNLIHKLANYYDKIHMRDVLTNVSPKDIHDLEEWMQTKLPNDNRGKLLRKIILENQDIYLALIKQK